MAKRIVSIDTSPEPVESLLQREGMKWACRYAPYSGTPTLNQQIIDLSVDSGLSAGIVGHTVYLKGVTIYATRDMEVELRVQNSAGWASNVGTFQTSVYLLAGMNHFVPYDGIIPYRARLQVLARSLPNGPVTITCSGLGWDIFATADLYAPNLILGIGDSITRGGNAPIDATNPYNTWFGQVVNHYLKQGIRVKGVDNAIPGGTALDQVTCLNWGRHNLSPEKVKLILLTLGTNTSASLSAYTAEMTTLVSRLHTMYPDALVLVGGPYPRGDAAESTLVTYRSALQTIVTIVNSPKVVYVNYGAAFTPASGVNIHTDLVHPLQAGHDAIATVALQALSGKTILWN